MLEGETWRLFPSENDQSAVIVKKLYGVAGEQFDVEPSSEIRNELKHLPAGTLVGIEYTPELNSKMNCGGLSISFLSKNVSYWNSIEKICSDANLKVVYLEDFSILPKMAKQKVIMNNCENLCEALEKSLIDKDKKERIQLLKLKHYEAETRYKFLFYVEKEKSMARKIAEQKPAVVIIDKGHAGQFLQNAYDIFFKDYSSEEVFVQQVPDLKDEELEEYLYDYNNEFEVPDDKWKEEVFSILETDRSVLNPYNVIFQQSCTRALKAVEEQKITDGNPDLMGTWQVDCWPKGLFELYIVKREGDYFCGRIEDVIGTSAAVGIITKDSLAFLKAYVPGKSLRNAVGPWIYYNAAFQPANGRYRGIWYKENDLVYEGTPFVAESGKIKIAHPICKYK